MRQAIFGDWWWPRFTGYNSVLAHGTSVPAGTSIGLQSNGAYVCSFGFVHWADHGSHTISTAGGGKIGWFTGFTVNWTDGTAEFRIGIQAPSATTSPMRPGGSWDVYRAMTTGSDSLTANTWVESVMTSASGTKTLAHGDYAMIVLEGVTASTTGRVTATVNNNNTLVSAYPGSTQNNAACGHIPFYIIADDGTYGFIDGIFPFYGASESFSDSTNPDERGMIFRVPMSVEVDAIGMFLGCASSSADARVRIYSDPLGTPAALATVNIDSNTVLQAASATERPSVFPIAPTRLDPGVDYCLAVKATDTAAIEIPALTYPNAACLAGHMGQAFTKYTRNGDSGAFGSADDNVVYNWDLRISALYPRPSPSYHLGI